MRPKILILDDEPDILALFATAFSEAPFDVVLCSSGLDALIAIFEGYAEGNPFDALVMDFALPRFDGFTIARMVRIAETTGVAPRAKIAYFSAFTKTVQQSTMLDEVGAEAYWQKPEDIVYLPKLIRVWLDGKDEWQRATDQTQSTTASSSS